MRARSFPVTDYKSKASRWDVYFKSIDMEAYVATLEYDDVTDFIEENMSNIPKGAKILDLGCGSGRHLHHLLKMGFTNLHGIDISPQGIENVKKHCPGVDATVGDATRLPYENNSFDVILMVGIIYEIEDSTLHPKLTSEIARTLKPGGKVIYINNSPYNLGERLYTFTQAIEKKLKNWTMRFFVWRFESEDVQRIFREPGLTIEKEEFKNVRRGVYRFFYNCFVPKEVRKQRTQQMTSSDGQPYSLHQYYLVRNQRELLTPLGNWIADMSQKHCPKLFANSICYIFKK